jgi:outer membrane protein TolC
MSILLALTMLFQTSWAAGEIQLTENTILEMIEGKPPGLDQVEASFLQAKFDHLSKVDKLSYRLDGAGQVYESKERSLGQFDPFTQSSTDYSLALNKPTKLGVDVGLKVFGMKSSNAFVQNSSTTGVSLNLSMDLLKNFLGRQTNNGLKQSALGLKRAELEKKAAVKTFTSNVRKVYWALVANEERQRFLKSLVQTSENQYRDTVKKNKSGVADDGEVARTRAQWSTRQSNLLSISYEKAQLTKSLREMLPDLRGKEIAPLKYSPDKIRADVLTCTTSIAAFGKAPLDRTHYDEIVGFLIEEEKLEQKVLDTYDDPSLKIIGEISSVGRGFGLENSRDDFFDDGQPRTSLGLQLSMPLGKRMKNSQEAAKALAKARYRSQAQSNLLKMEAFHSETVKMIQVLRQVVANQGTTNDLLEKSLKFSKKKYNQARIGLPEYIIEQEAFYQSKLNEIDSNLTVMNILMDYFSVFTETPCKLNSKLNSKKNSNKKMGLKAKL